MYALVFLCLSFTPILCIEPFLVVTTSLYNSRFLLIFILHLVFFLLFVNTEHKCHHRLD